MKSKKSEDQRKLTIRLVDPLEPDANGVSKETVSKAEGEEIHGEKILTILENHYCAHPLTPGYASGPENGKVLESGP